MRLWLSQEAAGGRARKQRARARARTRTHTCLTTPSRKSFSSRSLAPSSAHSFGRWRMSVPLTLTEVFGRAGILAPDARRSRPATVPGCPADVPGGRSPAPLSLSRRRACAVWIRARDMPCAPAQPWAQGAHLAVVRFPVRCVCTVRMGTDVGGCFRFSGRESTNWKTIPVHEQAGPWKG
jgi:hypothetical protein